LLPALALSNTLCTEVPRRGVLGTSGTTYGEKKGDRGTPPRSQPGSGALLCALEGSGRVAGPPGVHPAPFLPHQRPSAMARKARLGCILRAIPCVGPGLVRHTRNRPGVVSRYAAPRPGAHTTLMRYIAGPRRADLLSNFSIGSVPRRACVDPMSSADPGPAGRSRAVFANLMEEVFSEVQDNIPNTASQRLLLDCC
jgi:hypothetical protein